MHRELQDLGSFLHSGASYREELNPYARHFWIHPQPISLDALNLNPPISVYVFAAMVDVHVDVLRHALVVGTVLLFGGGVWLLLREYPDKRDPLVVLAVCSLAGVWHMVGYLQIYAPLFFAAVASWLLLRRGNLLLAGVAIGLVVAIKPNFALWPIFLLAAGHSRVAVSAVATAAGISAIPLIVDGPVIYRQWLELTMSFGGVQWASNASLMSIGARIGFPLAGEIVAVLAVLALLYWAWRSRADAHQASTLAILAVLLFGPVSWAGYTLFLLPYLLSRPWNHGVWLSVVMLALPFWLVRFMSMLGPVPNAIFGPAYGWALLLLLAVMIVEHRKDRAAAAVGEPRAVAGVAA